MKNPSGQLSEEAYKILKSRGYEIPDNVRQIMEGGAPQQPTPQQPSDSPSQTLKKIADVLDVPAAFAASASDFIPKLYNKLVRGVDVGRQALQQLPMHAIYGTPLKSEFSTEGVEPFTLPEHLAEARFGKLTPAQKEASRLGETVSDVLPWLSGMGEASAGMRAADVAKSRPLMNYLASILKSGGLGAALSDDPTTGGVAGALTQAGIGSLPLAFRGAAKYAERINPRKAIVKIGNGLKEFYQNNEHVKKGLFDSVLKDVGKKRMFAWPEIGYVPKIEFKGEGLVGPDSRRLLGDFKEDPTFENAHLVQSQLYRDAARYETAIPDKADKIWKLRNAFLDNMQNWLKRKHPQHLEDFNTARELHKNITVPFERHKTIDALVKGRQPAQKISMKKLHNALNYLIEDKRIGKRLVPGHPIRNAEEEIDSLKDRGEVTKALSRLLSLGLLGGGRAEEVGALSHSPYGSQLGRKTSIPYNILSRLLQGGIVSGVGSNK